MAAVAILLCSFSVDVTAQANSHSRGRLRVFLDCNSCDFDYLRREIEFIDYVRDRKEADLHVLVTTQGTGSGGTEYVFKFIGLGRFDHIDDELKYASSQTNTSDERRAGYARVLKLGLVRYVTSTSLAERLQVVYKEEEEQGGTPNGPKVDPWNYWVFRTRASASFSGEESTQNHSFSGSFTGNRVTEQWKVNSSVNLNVRESQYTLSDGEDFIDKSHDHNASVLVVKSLGEHWSAAVRGRLGSSTFLNQDRALRAAAGVEYSFFPYRVSATRELTAQLTLGLNRFDYTELTIYDKEKETVADALFIVGFDLTQPWGSTEVTLETLTYLHDPGRHRVELDGGLDVRLFKGFSLNLGGSISRIRDQLYLQKGDATDEEILLRRRQLATDYRYEFRMGFSYTFGSIFNNIVNTRF
ncbi:hypothetical protein BH18ACI5_BH18ACI5_12460 [soil metagenome]